MQTRQLYASANGDRWYLAREDDTQQVFILHRANVPSGGHDSRIDIGTFLSRKGNSPEQQALLRLIGTLTEIRLDAEAP